MTSPHEGPPSLSNGVLAGLLVGALLGGGLTYLGVVAVASELRLRSGSAVVEAEVQGTRVMTSRRVGTTYEVRYAFTLPGAPETYTLRDETGRDGLWTAVPEDDWDAARASGKLAVRYLPEDPWSSRPVNSEFAPLGDAIAGLVLGLFLLLPCLLAIVVGIRGRRARAASAAHDCASGARSRAAVASPDGFNR